MQSVSPISPYAHIPIQYATKNTRQYATAPDTSPLLNQKEAKYIQSVTGTFPNYCRALEFTILPALNEIDSAQSSPTKKTQAQDQKLMNYLVTYSNTYTRYYASDIILIMDSNAAYLVDPKSCSRVVIYYHFTNNPSTPSLQAGDPVHNTLVTLATQLNRIEYIPDALSKYHAASPRVVPPTLPHHSSSLATLPRVTVTLPSPSPSPPVSVLQARSTTPKNKRFHNKTKHQYPLRSKT